MEFHTVSQKIFTAVLLYFKHTADFGTNKATGNNILCNEYHRNFSVRSNELQIRRGGGGEWE
jgi:hypothetical protein